MRDARRRPSRDALDSARIARSPRPARDTPRLDAELLLAHALGVDRARADHGPRRAASTARRCARSRTSSGGARSSASRSPTSLGTQGLSPHRARGRPPRAGPAAGDRAARRGRRSTLAAGRARARRRHRQRRGRAGAQARAPGPERQRQRRQRRRARGRARERASGSASTSTLACRPTCSTACRRRSTPSLANPPYVAEPSARAAAGVLRHEPPAALFAGPDGLDVIRRLIDAAAAARALLARSRSARARRAQVAELPSGRTSRCVRATSRASSAWWSSRAVIDRRRRDDLRALHGGRRRRGLPGRHRLRPGLRPRREGGRPAAAPAQAPLAGQAQRGHVLRR